MKYLNFSAKGPTTFKTREMKLCLSLIISMLGNLHLVGWLQSYGSKKALFCGKFANHFLLLAKILRTTIEN